MVSVGRQLRLVDREVERQVQRLEQEPGLVEADVRRALEFGHVLRCGLDQVEVAGLHPDHDDARVVDDLPAGVQLRRAVPVVGELLETQPLTAIPGRQLVGSAACLVGGHELVGLALLHATVLLDRVLADYCSGRRIGDGAQEIGGRLLDLHLEPVRVDDAGRLDEVGQFRCLALGQVHRHHAVPRELDVVGVQVGAVVELHALTDGEGIRQAVGGDQTVLLGRYLRRDHRYRIGTVRRDVDQEVVHLDDGPIAEPAVGGGRRVERFGLTAERVDEHTRVLDFGWCLALSATTALTLGCRCLAA